MVSAVFAGLLMAVLFPQQAQAVSGDQFDPGYIISDQRFFDSGSRTEAQVQSFLNARVLLCRSTNPNLPCVRHLRTSTSHRAATAYCRAYASEGWESAARVITKVARACDINPEVLIVLLEKEQGLITSTAPSQYAYDRAMGFACPDGAPCNSQYFGFFNQVYAAASRLQQYTKTASSWNYKIGANTILYHPNRSCGSGRVTIRNQATANLYIYTPYQPNAAALRNLYGTGDSCSSYGNRNFWRIFSDWFGSPTVQGIAQIDAEYARRSGTLGTATSDYLAVGTRGSGRAYQQGSIYWTSATGARSVYGPIKTLYFRRDGATGPLGFPTGDIASYPVKGTSQTGQGQAFENGSVFTWQRGTFEVPLFFRKPWVDDWKGISGQFGWPISSSAQYAANGGGEGQAFENGSFFRSGGRVFAVAEPIRERWVAAGGVSGSIGWPISAEARYPANGGGTGQAFQNGSVFSSRAGVFTVSGPVRTWWVGRGGVSGSFGWPTSASSCARGVCSQSFQGGIIQHETATGRVSAVVAPELAAYQAAGGVTGALGASLGNVGSYKANGGGTGQAFVGGSIFTTSRGTFTVLDPVRASWVTLGGVSGAYGWPVGPSARYAANGGGTGQAFQNGSFFTSGAGTYPVPADLRTLWVSRGGVSGPDGWPIAAPVAYTANGGGTAQAFQNGSVFKSRAGTFMVAGTMRTTWVAQGGVSGRWGWPTGSMTCQGNTCRQAFQGGTLTTGR